MMVVMHQDRSATNLNSWLIFVTGNNSAFF